MKKVYPIQNGTGKNVGYGFFCPACKYGHVYYTDMDNRPKWEFNGDKENPTFTPSLLNNANNYNDNNPRCHIFVTDGKIHFLSDCTHDMAGQTVEMGGVE